MSKREISALSVRQPWAWFIVNGHKDVENRTWKPKGTRIGQRFAIHASQRRLSKADYEYFLELIEECGIKRYPKSIDDFDYGAIVGTVVLDDVVRGSKSYWAGRGSYHWVLSKAKKVRPKKVKGQLGFFRVKGV